MTRNTFDFVLELVGPYLRRRTTNWRQPLEPRFQLAIAVWWYTTPGEYRSISIFGVGVSTVCVLVRQVTAALMKGFTNHHALDQQKRNFKYRLSSARMVVDHDFGDL